MIKRLYFSLLTVLLISGMAFAATPGYRQNPGTGDIMGSGKYPSDAHKIFRLVRYVPPSYSGATTLAANSIVTWDLTADDGVTVTTTTTSSDSAVAGVIVTQALTPDVSGNTAAQDVGKSNWTWLQTYGYGLVNLVSGGSNVSAGHAFGTSTTAGNVAPYDNTVNDPGRVGIAGFFYDAATAGDTGVKVFLRLD